MAARQFATQRYSRLKPGRDAYFDALAVDFLPEKHAKLSELRVLTFGSCFAGNIHEALLLRVVRSATVGFTEEVNSPFMNAVYISHLIHGEASKYKDIYSRFAGHDWHQDGASAQQVLPVMREANVIVFTVGLAQIWSDRQTNTPVLLPDFDDLDAYTTRFLYPKPQSDFIVEIIEAVRTVNRDAQIVVTLSPVPLQMSMSHASVAQADCISKSILRVAIQLVMEKKLPRVHYFPSFEFFRWYSGHSAEQFFGVDGKMRHPSQEIIDFVVAKFLARIVA